MWTKTKSAVEVLVSFRADKFCVSYVSYLKTSAVDRMAHTL